MTDDMKRIYILTTLTLLLLVSGSMRVLADDFDPTLPPDPRARFKVTTTVSPSAAGYASGAGSYEKGTTVTVSTSANSGYVFDHWELNGQRYDGATDTHFSYVTSDSRADFVAVYTFNPNIPADPQQNIKCRLYLEPSTAGACSFNRTSGDKWTKGASVYVTAYASQGYEFQGWYEGETFISSNASFTYTMSSDNDVTLTARYAFNPTIPGDPQSSATDIANPEKGDVNDDGKLTMGDVVKLVNHILEVSQTGFNADLADVNEDGKVTMGDVVFVLNMILSGDYPTKDPSMRQTAVNDEKTEDVVL